MNKILLAGLALLFLLRKKPKKSDDLQPIDTDIVAPDGGLTGVKKLLYDSIIAMFEDNLFVPKQVQINSIIEEIEKNSLPDCEYLYSFFNQILDGAEISDYTNQQVDKLAPKFPKLFQMMATIGVQNMGSGYKEYGARDGNSDVWAMLETMSNFLPNGNIVYGVAQFIGNLFCGKKCRARRLERLNISDEAKFVTY